MVDSNIKREEILSSEKAFAFVPVGGTYTMDFKEAAKLINIIKHKVIL